MIGGYFKMPAALERALPERHIRAERRVGERALLDCLPDQKVRVVASDVGGACGLKAHVYVEEILVAWIAQGEASFSRLLQDWRWR